MPRRVDSDKILELINKERKTLLLRQIYQIIKQFGKARGRAAKPDAEFLLDFLPKLFAEQTLGLSTDKEIEYRGIIIGLKHE